MWSVVYATSTCLSVRLSIPSFAHCCCAAGLLLSAQQAGDIDRLLHGAQQQMFGERAFSRAGPATWNALPDHIRTVADPVKFRKLLKSHYFSQAFNTC